MLAYLVGSVPFGYLLIRATRGLDVRNYGSRSVGAINVVRVGGIWLGLLTLLGDIGKAFGMVLLAAALGGSPGAVAGSALLVMIGHIYSPWFLFRKERSSGGKSVACALGVLLALACHGALPWRFALLPLAVWLLCLLGPRLLTGRWYWISPATMAASASIPLAMWLGHPARAYLLLSIGMAALILARHKDNIKRLRAGTEPRLGERLRDGPGESVDKKTGAEINLASHRGKP